MEKAEVDKLVKLVDEFVASLKKELLAIEVPSKGIFPGMWDKMKNWWYSITKGKNNPENPYMYQHKFGALGQQESKRLSLSQYKFVRECYEDLENSLNILTEETAGDSENIKKLKLFKIIDSWAERFKKAILKQFNVTGDIESEPTASQPVVSSPTTSTAPMTAIPEKGTESVAEEEEERAGAGRTAPLVINWSSNKQKFIVRDKIGGKKKVRGLKLTEVMPISELVKIQLKNKRGEPQVSSTTTAAAENNLKLFIYHKLISQLPGTDRHVTGYGESPVVFDVDQKIFDTKFVNTLKEVLNEFSSGLKSTTKTTTGVDLHKKITREMYSRLDREFSDRADSYHSRQGSEDIDLILRGAAPPT